MTKNPFINALLAVLYIALIASFMYFTQGLDNRIPGFLGPMTFLSLFVLSAAFMGMVFFYRPARMYLDGDKSPAVKLLGETIGVFACATAVLLVVIALI